MYLAVDIEDCVPMVSATAKVVGRGHYQPTNSPKKLLQK